MRILILIDAPRESQEAPAAFNSLQSGVLFYSFTALSLDARNVLNFVVH